MYPYGYVDVGGASGIRNVRPRIWSPPDFGIGCTQFAPLRPSALSTTMGMRTTTLRPVSEGCGPVTTRNQYWLRAIVDYARLSYFDSSGNAYYIIASYLFRVRPRHHQIMVLDKNNHECS